MTGADARNAERAASGITREMLWDERGRAMRFQITENGLPIEQLYAREDLQRVEPTT